MSGSGGKRRGARALLLLLLAGAAGGVALALAARLAPLPAGWSGPAAGVDSVGVVTVRDRHGGLVAQIRTREEAWVPVRAGDVDLILRAATLAAEDRRFRWHPGIDPLSAARAAGQNLLARRRVSGGSTLTQQVAKLLRARARAAPAPRGLHEKAAEAWAALRLEAHLGKDEILERYWNEAPYGVNVRGVGAACRLYFGHGAETLTDDEAALLAAIPRSPVRTDPRRDPDRARAARDRVLRRMRLPPERLAAALERPLRIDPPSPPPTGGAPHWIAAVRARHPDAAELTLPLDPELQEAATRALRDVLRELSARGADAGAVVVLHNPTGEVRAWVGSPDWRDPRHGQFDAARALRQPGSTLKPFTYALAFEEGLRPADLLPDLPLEYGGAGDDWRPRNYSGRYHGPVRARLALANSWNAPAVAVAARLGTGPLLARLREAGFRSLDGPAERYGLGLTLGDGEVTLLEQVTAYACLARGGLYRERIDLLAARDAGGARLGPAAAAAGAGPRRVFDPRAAFLVQSILSDPEARARAFGRDGAFAFPFPVALKTGTSSDWRDNWALGFTPEWTVGAWLGQAGGAPMDRISGTHGAIRLLRAVLLFLHEERAGGAAQEEFEPPPGLERRAVCALSGEAPGPDCPETLLDWFGVDDPRGPVCRWHVRIPLDAATGRRACACTPPERVRLLLLTRAPADAPDGAPFGWPGELYAAWGRDHGWPAPPAEAACPRCADASAVAAGPDAGPPAPPTADGETASWPPRGGALPPGRTPVRILRPSPGTVYALDPSLPAAQQQIELVATSPTGSVRWLVNGRDAGVSAAGERRFWPLAPGSHVIRAEAHGAAPPGTPGAEARIAVEPAP